MILSNGPDPGKLSATSRRMLELRDAVLHEWVKRVRTSIKEAGPVSHPILIDTFPALYESIAVSITSDYSGENAVDSNTTAAEHGSERARLTNFNPQAIVGEYQTLRWAIFDVLKQHGVLFSDDEIFIVNHSIDSAIRKSVDAFAVIKSALRERFIATLGHDMRTPLASASLAAELILHTADPPKTKDLANRIVENLGRVDRMIQDLLNTVAFQGGERLHLHLSNFDIREIAQYVCEQSVAVHGPRFQILGGSVKGWWDRNAMTRALENLVGNAVKYGGPDTPIRINFDEVGGRLVLSVHNEGDPIPPDQQESIFQVFRRAEAAKEGKKQGWGLGLPNVRSVAESHGGSVAIDSLVERGTTFVIDIPVDSRPYQNAPAF